MKTYLQEVLCLVIVLSAVFLHLRVGFPYIEHDTHRSAEFRFSRHHDEGNNNTRALASQTDRFRELTNSPRGQRQLHFFIARLPQSMLSLSSDLKTRILVSLRMTSVLSFAVLLFLTYVLARTQFAPWLSLWLWSCFVAGTGHYVYSAYHAKEDMLCLVFLVLVLLLWNSWFRKPSPWKWYLSTVMVGLGAAIKMYPLFLVILYLPISIYSYPNWKERIHFIAISGFITGVSLFVVNPNYYLSLYHFKGFIFEYAIETMATAEPSLWARAIRYLEILNTVLVFHLRYIWLASLLAWVGVWFSKSPLRDPRATALSFILRERGFFVAFLGLYYMLSVYKQHISPDPKYFLIGEICLLFWMGAMIQRLALIQEPLQRFGLLSGVFLVTFWLCWLPGSKKMALQLSRMERDYYDAYLSTTDRLAEYLRSIPRRPKKVFAVHGTSLPSGEFDLVLGWGVNLKAIREIANAEVVVTKKWPEDSESSWNSEKVDPGNGTNCLRLMHLIEPQGDFPLKTSLISAYRSLDRLRSHGVRSGLVSGPSYAIYDSRGCL